MKKEIDSVYIVETKYGNPNWLVYGGYHILSLARKVKKRLLKPTVKDSLTPRMTKIRIIKETTTTRVERKVVK